jgi:hypothetical protein
MGTVLYILGGYFLPFVVYSAVMLLWVPFVAKYIPSKPLEDKDFMIQPKKWSDQDIEVCTSDMISTDEDSQSSLNDETQIDETDVPKKQINPFKLVWELCKNKVKHLCY